jgi:hypothetical protein
VDDNEKPRSKTCLADTCETGSAAFIGAGIYSYHSGMANLRKQEKNIMQSTSQYKMGSRRLGVGAIAATLISMGIYRAFN